MHIEFPRELLPHQVNQIRPEVVGFHAMNSGVANNSPSRSTMMSSHMSQHLVINGSELPHVLSTTEVEYSKYTTKERASTNVRVVQVIDRYPSGIGQNSLSFNPETLVVVCDDETATYDVIVVPYHKSYHQYFGYVNKFKDIMDTIAPGTLLPKDAVLADTPANIGDFYTQSVNLNTVLLSADVVAEDSVLVSEEARDLMETSVFERRTASVGAKKFPVNIGGGSEYKCMYDIGEYVPLDGALMFLREYSEGLSPVLMSRSTTKQVIYGFDEGIYARQGIRGRIVDIKVTGNAELHSFLPPEMAAQLEKYRLAYIDFCKRLLETEKKIRREAYSKFGMKEPKLMPDLHRRLVTARAHCDDGRERFNKSLQGLMNKNPLDEYHVEITVEYKLKPTIGWKVTSYNGDKGVITQFLPRRRMPRDKFGNVADIAMGPDGTVARTNYARLYLMYLGASAILVTKELKAITGLDETCSLEEVQYLSEDKLKAAWDLLMTAHGCVNPKVAEILSEMSKGDHILHIYECLEAGLSYVRDVGCAKPLPHAVLDINNWMPVPCGPVTHQLIEDGREETTVDDILIGPLPIIVLDKTAEDTLTVATAAHGPFGVLVKHNQADKYTKPWKDSPPRTLGESENRAFAAHTKDPEMVADMMDRANNPDVQLDMSRTIVSSETPGNIPELVNREIHDYGNARPLGIANNYLECYGVVTQYTPEDMHPEERIQRKR